MVMEKQINPSAEERSQIVNDGKGAMLILCSTPQKLLVALALTLVKQYCLNEKVAALSSKEADYVAATTAVMLLKRVMQVNRELTQMVLAEELTKGAAASLSPGSEDGPAWDGTLGRTKFPGMM